MPKYYAQFDFNKITVKGFIPEASGTAPASPATGQLWTDTSGATSLLKRWDGTRWEVLGEILDGSITTAKLADGAVTDAKLAGSISNSKLATNPLSRANHTGTQSASTISDFDAQVRTSRLDQLQPATSDLDLGGKKVTNVGAPTAASDAANKAYVDSARAGISVKDPVKAVASGNVNLASPGVIDGITFADGERFLAPEQTTASENGIYEWHTSGATRAYDSQPGDVEDGSVVAVAEGTSAGYQWIQTAASGSDQDWTVFATGGQTYTAGAGLSQSGNTFSLPTVPVALGGTGATTAPAARVNLDAAGAYGATVDAADLPGGGTAVTITHGLNTHYIGVFVTLDSTGERIELDWKVTGANTIDLSSEIALDDDVNVCVVGA